MGAAGELGHMTVEAHGPLCGCGNRGCLEALASGRAVAQEVRRRLEQGETSALASLSGEELTAERVFRAAWEDDALAQEVVARAAFYLGVGLASLINIFNPEVIAIGGSLARDWDWVERGAVPVAQERAMPLPYSGCRILPARLGDDSSLLGAAALVLEARGLL